MFTKKRKREETSLEAVTRHAFETLQDTDITSEEYARVLEHAVKLHKMKEEEAPSRVRADTVALIAANLAGILLILSHEHANVITSKALGFVLKPR